MLKTTKGWIDGWMDSRKLRIGIEVPGPSVCLHCKCMYLPLYSGGAAYSSTFFTLFGPTTSDVTPFKTVTQNCSHCCCLDINLRPSVITPSNHVVYHLSVSSSTAGYSAAAAAAASRSIPLGSGTGGSSPSAVSGP
jgi:hypothetical protein